MELKPLTIGNLTARIPIIQGGMGVGISLSRLAGAVAKEGAIGVISAAQTGYAEPDFTTNTLAANQRALKYHIKKAKEISGGGIVGVNIMCATDDYEDYVSASVEGGADLIISGAGLPMKLPLLLKDTGVKFAPIVSSLKAISVLFRAWEKRYQATCDFVVVEGPMAGGHMGFSNEELADPATYENYGEEVKAIVAYVREHEEKYQKHIPVVLAGGIYDRADIDWALSLGCEGVQMATRFVATEECDADENFKQAFLDARKEDVTITKSPVGMPARGLRNAFVKLREAEKEKITYCFRCLKPCNPATTPYCITMALVRAAQGDCENALILCGSNAWRLDKITTVPALLAELTQN